MRKVTIVLVLILALLSSATGCSKPVLESVEQGKPTVEYLTGALPKKLEGQGAEIYSGKITKAESLSASTSQITFVEIKDGKKQKPKDIPLDTNAQVVYVTNSNPDGAVMDGKGFVKAFVPGNKDDFKIFIMNDKVLLLLSAGL